MFGDKEFKQPFPKYPTPEDVPLESACRTFTIPSSAAWLGVFMGMLMQGLEEENWQQFEGGISPAAAVDEWKAIFASGYGEGGVCSTLDRPYWDDADADDTGESETDGFPWYEDASDWVVASFLASAGLGGAAFEFVTIARQFRLAFRKRDYGAIINIFLDNELQATVDTYSATEGVAYVDIITPSALPGFSALVDPSYVLRVEHSGTHNPLATPLNGMYWLEAIRKRLYAGEVYPSDIRFNEETGEVEYTPDGGETWTPAPGGDPRFNPTFLFPPRGGSDPRCDAAANMVTFIENIIDQVVTALAFTSSAAGLITLLLSIFAVLGPWAVLITLFAALASAMFDAGVTALVGGFQPADYDTLRCIFYCRIGNDGRVSPEQLAGIRDDVGALLNPIASTILNLMFDLSGNVGLSNMGAQGNATADCSECAGDPGETWSKTFNFLEDPHGFAPFATGASPNGGWTEGIGFRPGAPYTGYKRSTAIRSFFLTCEATVTRVGVIFSGDQRFARQVWVSNPARTVWQGVNDFSNTPATPPLIDATVSWDTQGTMALSWLLDTPDGYSFTVVGFIVEGTGSEPSW